MTTTPWGPGFDAELQYQQQRVRASFGRIHEARHARRGHARAGLTGALGGRSGALQELRTVGHGS